MTHTTHSFRYAGSAIAAALAIGSTQGFAQDAAAPFPATPEAVLVTPDVPAPVAPVPTVVLPSELPPPAGEPETVQAIPPEPAPPVVTDSTPAAAPAAQRIVRQPAPAPRAEAVEPATPEEPAALPPVITMQPVAEPVFPVAVERIAPTSTRDDTGLIALILGGLAFLALAIWGFLAIGRRKPIHRYVAENTVPMPAPAAVHKPIAVDPELPVAHYSAAPERLAPRPAMTAGALAHAGASVALPARTPGTYAERDALMKRMIAARPDRANPFTDRGARTRRARLILQSLGRDFGVSEPWIDLSQYPHNWPELANQRSAAA